MATESAQTNGTLQDVRIIGFTGHRTLKNPQAVAIAIRAELESLKKEGGQLIAISSVAVGADTLFAEEVLRAGIKWIVVLPLPEEIFAQDFTAEEWTKAKGLIEQAAEERVLRASDRPQAYADAGMATVDDSDFLFAVWDGEPARGPGGTAEVVSYARQLGREIIIFREGNEKIEKVAASRVQSIELTPEEVLKAMGTYTKLPLPPQSLMVHFDESDKGAIQTNFRRDTMRMAGFHLAATLVAGLSLALHAHGFESYWGSIFMAAMKVVLVSCALAILIFIRETHKHEILLQERKEAEYWRSVLATWHCRDPIEPVSFHEVPELRRLAKSVLFLRLEKNRHSLVDLNTFRVAYAHERVMDQYQYFKQEGDKAEAKAGPLRKRYWIYTVAAFAFSLLLLGLRWFDPTFDADTHVDSPWYIWILSVLLDLSPLAFPAMASFTLTRRSIQEVDRRLGRFRDLQKKMHLTLIELSFCDSWDSLCRLVRRTEKVLFNEVLEWSTILQYSATD
jgi:hypothetical protein